jgi:hypothetical protein
MTSRIHPGDRLTLDQSVVMAALTALESLAPDERAAFLLSRVFGFHSQNGSKVLRQTPAQYRTLVAVACRRMAVRQPPPDDCMAEVSGVAADLLAALAARDLTGTLHVLDKDVVVHSDGAGRVATHISGRARVACYLFDLVFGGDELAMYSVRGWWGIVGFRDGYVACLIGLASSVGRVVEIDVVSSPSKLQGFVEHFVK